MKQAKVLSKAEISRVLAVIDAGNHPSRNRAAFMCSDDNGPGHWLPGVPYVG